MKILQAVVAAALSLAAALPSQGVPVLQEAPSYRMSLSGPGLVAAGANVTLRLVVDVVRDADVPAAVVNGADLTVRVNGKDADPIASPGKGGDVSMVAGTRIERRMTFPLSAWMSSIP